ncbi:MAG: EamA family transporter [Acidobacteriaceae bacterium]|nr:EamA family transporter [Acidobacteriaceae bacterium]
MLVDQPRQIMALIGNGQVLNIGNASQARAGRSAFPSRTQIMLGFAAIYLIWGSTYLGIRYAVETIPPFLMMGIRHLTAGLVVFAYARMRGAAAPQLRHWVWALGAGILLFLGGHGILAWAEQKVPSGLAALLCATLPLWTVLLARVDGTEGRLGLKAWAGILLGFGGVALLIGPDALGQRLDLLAAAGVLSSALLWAVGTGYTRRVELPSSKILSAAMQMICGGALLLLVSFSSGEAGRVHIHALTLLSLLSLAYLTIFGSIVAFTVYTWLVPVSSPSMLSTYAYVNPVIAVLLGWAVAHEALGLRTIVATLVIVAGVILVGTRRKHASGAHKTEPVQFRRTEFAAD